MIVLEVLEGEQQGRHYEFDGAPGAAFTIGRGPACHIPLTDIHLSGTHGEIFREEDRFVYRDLRSTNGSRLLREGNRIDIDRDRSEIALKDGDQLLLGDPTGPVVLACRVTADEGDEAARVIAVKPLSELPELSGRLERDPGGAAALYP